jgi:hypothetical protein
MRAEQVQMQRKPAASFGTQNRKTTTTSLICCPAFFTLDIEQALARLLAAYFCLHAEQPANLHASVTSHEAGS